MVMVILLLFITLITGTTPHEGLVETLSHEVSASIHGIHIGATRDLRGGVSKDNSMIIQNATLTQFNISSYDIISCQSMDDYYALLYRVCIQSIQCSELFYLTQPITGEDEDPIQVESDKRKFKFQLLTTNIFLVTDEELLSTLVNGSLLSINETLKPFIMQETWPEAWFPTHLIQLTYNNDSAPCQALELTLIENKTFVMDTLYLLQTYKSYLANQNYCSHHNERLIMDANGQFYCVCKLGKDCNSESNFRKASIFLQVALLIAIVIAIIAIVIDSRNKLEKLTYVRNKHKYE
jgi:hypothetical protein